MKGWLLRLAGVNVSIVPSHWPSYSFPKMVTAKLSSSGSGSDARSWPGWWVVDGWLVWMVCHFFGYSLILRYWSWLKSHWFRRTKYISEKKNQQLSNHRNNEWIQWWCYGRPKTVKISTMDVARALSCYFKPPSLSCTQKVNDKHMDHCSLTTMTTCLRYMLCIVYIHTHMITLYAFKLNMYMTSLSSI